MGGARFRSTLAALGFFAATAAATAGAAGPRTGEAQTVAQASSPGGKSIRVLAQDASGGGLCVDLHITDETPQTDSRCPAPETGARNDATPDHMTYRSAGGRMTAIYGVTSSATRALELTLSNGRRVRVATVAPTAYTGAHAAGVRFYLAVLRRAPEVASARALDAAGRERAEVDVDPLALRAIRGPVTLGRARDQHGRSAPIRAVVTRAVRGDRRRRAVCVGIRSSPVARRDRVRGGGAACAFRRNQVIAGVAADCQTRRVVVFGVAAAAVDSVTAVLVDGTRRNVRLIPLPARLRRPGRAMVLELANGAELVRFEAYALDGGLLTTLHFGGNALRDC